MEPNTRNDAFIIGTAKPIDMKNEIVRQLLTQADAAFDLASEEQMRPVEDVVPFSICHNSRVSIRIYLMTFLIKNGVQPDSNESMKELLARCSKIDKKFSKLDISDMECRSSKADKNDEYCLSVAKVTNCFEAANEVKKLVNNLE
jgi:hypothetical protein